MQFLSIILITSHHECNLFHLGERGEGATERGEGEKKKENVERGEERKMKGEKVGDLPACCVPLLWIEED